MILIISISVSFLMSLLLKMSKMFLSIVLIHDFTEIISKQAIKLTPILKVNFEWKFDSISVKSVLCILKIYTNYKLPMFRTNFLKLKFWKLLSNSRATFNLENVNLLSNPNVNLQNGLAY